VSNRKISVSVKDGVISLWGQVASTTERSAIEILAKTAKGGPGVENQLMVVAGMPYDEQL
jgi:osmotically-inducible protein OsmY